MPLVPFDLFNDETRLIMHTDCLYKLKLTYKSEISLKKISTHQRDETNAELIKVIRAILFCIKTERDVPRKISSPCFLACVAVKFWKITKRLSFSKNGTRLKSGHIIYLTLCIRENRFQRTEYPEVNTRVDTESFSKSNHQDKHVQQSGHLGLRQFVINSDESDCDSEVIPCEPPLTIHSSSVANEFKNIISKDIAGPTENFEIFGCSDLRHGPEKHPDPSVRNSISKDLDGPTENVESIVSRTKHPDQSVRNKHNSISKDIDGPTEIFGRSDLQHGKAMHPDKPVRNRRISKDTDEPTGNLSKSVVSPDSQHGQVKPSDQSPRVLDEDDQTVSNLVSKNLVEQPALSHPPPEDAETSVQIEATFVSSCTQTDVDELDFYAKKPDPNSKGVDETFSQVHSDHNYFKSGSSISNSKDQSTQEKETLDHNGSSVINLDSSLSENGNEGNTISIHDSDVSHTCPEEDSSQAEFLSSVENVEILNARSEDVRLSSLVTDANANSKDNDIWGIENKQLGVVSGGEIPMESRSESSQDSVKDSSKHLSETISNQYSKKYTETDQSTEQAVQHEESSNTERCDSSPGELKKNQFSKPRRSSEISLKDIIRNKRSKSSNRDDYVPPQKVMKVKNNKKNPKSHSSTFRPGIISARRKRNRSTPLSEPFASGVKRTPARRRHSKSTPQSQASASGGKRTKRERRKATPKRHASVLSENDRDVSHTSPEEDSSQAADYVPPQKVMKVKNIKKNPKSQSSTFRAGIISSRRKQSKSTPMSQASASGGKRTKNASSKHPSSVSHKRTPTTGERRKRGRPRSKDAERKKITKPKNEILNDQKKIMISLLDRSQFNKKRSPTGKPRQRGRPRSKDVTPKKKTSPNSEIPYDEKEKMIGLCDRSQVNKKTSSSGKQCQRGRPRSKDATPKKKTSPKSEILGAEKEITIGLCDRSQINKKRSPSGKPCQRGRPRSKDVTPKKKTSPKSEILDDEKEIAICLRDRSQVNKKTSSSGKQHQRGRPRSKDATPKKKTSPKSEILDDEKEIAISLRDRSQINKKTLPTRRPCKSERLQSPDVTQKEKTNSKSGIMEDQITFGLHDRFKVQNQELQEDLKLQNLAHPSSTSTNKKARSFMERFHLGYFLR